VKTRSRKFIEDYNPELDLKVTCPKCNADFYVGKLTANQHQTCPMCRNQFDIPDGVIDNPDPDYRTYGHM